MKLTVIGSGSPKPSSVRMNSSYLVEIGSDRILFDHGFGAGQRLVQLGIEAQSITHVFLTHLHYDHVGDVARLILTRWDQMRSEHDELNIYGPPPLRQFIDKLIGEDGAFATDIRARIESNISRELYSARGGRGLRNWPRPKIHELNSGDIVSTKNWQVKCAKAIHCPGYLECLGYRIDGDRKSIVYTGDTGPSEEITELAKGCDLFVHMCSRKTGGIVTPAIEESSIGHLETARSAASAGAGTLLLTHIEHLNDPETRVQTMAEITEIFDGTCLIADDMMVFDLTNNTHAFAAKA
ncbi:MAG: MBL fold metallo-hydrolase [Devosiaceae bacterium]|nr:MBL fold metallo-hydrolase [Devosiaceae bacterium]